MEQGGAGSGGGAQAARALSEAEAFERMARRLLVKMAEPQREVLVRLDAVESSVERLGRAASDLAVRLGRVLPRETIERWVAEPSEPPRVSLTTLGERLVELEARIDSSASLVELLSAEVQV